MDNCEHVVDMCDAIQHKLTAIKYPGCGSGFGQNTSLRCFKLHQNELKLPAFCCTDTTAPAIQRLRAGLKDPGTGECMLQLAQLPARRLLHSNTVFRTLASRSAVTTSIRPNTAAVQAVLRTNSIARHLSSAPASKMSTERPSSPPPSFPTTPIPAHPEGTHVATAACLIIGDEVLNGKTKDSNSNFMARMLFDLGIELKR